MNDLLEQPMLGAKFAAAARAKVETSFSAEGMAREVEAIYRRCLGDAPAAAEVAPQGARTPGL